jgi:hypothetical protein
VEPRLTQPIMGPRSDGRVTSVKLKIRGNFMMTYSRQNCIPACTSTDYNACWTVKNLTIKFTISWFPVVIIRDVNYQHISGHTLVDFCTARCQLLCRGVNQLRQLGPLVGLEVNLQFGTRQTSGCGLGVPGWSGYWRPVNGN